MNFYYFTPFFSFFIYASFSKPLVPNVVPWLPVKTALAASVGTLANDEGRMSCYCSLLFIISFFSLLIYPNIFIVIFFLLVMFFPFFWPILARSLCAVATIVVTLYRPHTIKPYARWRQGPRLLFGGTFPLLRCQGVADVPRIL